MEQKEEAFSASARWVFPAPGQEKEASPLLYPGSRSSSEPASSLQLFVSVRTTGLPLLPLDSSSPLLLFFPPFFFRSMLVCLATLMMGREEGLW